MNSWTSADSGRYDTIKPVRETSLRFKARIAGVLYLISVLTAVYAEFFARGRWGLAAVVIPISCYITVTLLLCSIFVPVNRSLSLLAASFNLVGFTFEALRSYPRGVNAGMVFHGLYCLLIGYLIFASTFLPRILGVLMAFAGLVWLLYLSPPMAKYLSPYNTASGILGEGLPMLWLLVMGVNVQRWKELPALRRNGK
jgi:Domain of unknown function (DUF4386)